MKRFDELEPEQQDLAVNHETDWVLQAILEGCLEIRGTKRIVSAAWKEMERMQTPWFIGEVLMERIGDKIKAIGKSRAESALYAEPGEYVIHGIAK